MSLQKVEPVILRKVMKIVNKVDTTNVINNRNLSNHYVIIRDIRDVYM